MIIYVTIWLLLALFYHNTVYRQTLNSLNTLLLWMKQANLWKAFLHCFADLKLQTNKNHQTRQTCISNCDSQTTIFFLFQYFIINKSITDTLFLIIIIIILIIIIIIKSCRKITKKPFLRSMKQAKQVKIRSNYSAILHVNKCLYCNWWRLNILSKIRTETFPHTAYEHKKLKLKQCLLCDGWRL